MTPYPVLLAALAVALGLPVPALSAKPEAAKPGLVYVETDSRVEVDATGKVVSIHTTPELPAEVRAVIENNLRQLQFAPPMKDGRAVAGVTFVQQDACAAPDGGAYRFAVKMRGNGPSLDQRYFPVYPHEAMRAGREGKFKVTYRIGVDGKTQFVDATRISEGKSGYDRGFRSAIENWVAALHFQPEVLDGQPVATQVTDQVDFVLDDNPAKAIKDAERQRTEGSDACKLALSDHDDAPHRVALDSPFKPLPVATN
jgi:outer membrane biosynthesis protein TonB